MRKLPGAIERILSLNPQARSVSINEYLKTDSVPIDKISYVETQKYTITRSENELITDGLNVCSALSFEAQGKVFFGHFTKGVESRIPEIIRPLRHFIFGFGGRYVC
jgi:hypothetical protein